MNKNTLKALALVVGINLLYYTFIIALVVIALKIVFLTV